MRVWDKYKPTEANLDSAASEEEWNLSRSNVRSSLVVAGESESGWSDLEKQNRIRECECNTCTPGGEAAHYVKAGRPE